MEWIENKENDNELKQNYNNFNILNYYKTEYLSLYSVFIIN